MGAGHYSEGAECSGTREGVSDFRRQGPLQSTCGWSLTTSAVGGPSTCLPQDVSPAEVQLGDPRNAHPTSQEAVQVGSTSLLDTEDLNPAKHQHKDSHLMGLPSGRGCRQEFLCVQGIQASRMSLKSGVHRGILLWGRPGCLSKLGQQSGAARTRA